MSTHPAPIIAVTAGDPAGIGPDVALQAATDDRVRRRCRPLLIGHPEVFHRAARIRPTVGEPHYIAVPLDVDRPELERVIRVDGDIPVLNPVDDAAASMPAGIVSAAAGHAAFVCLTTAIDLTQRNIVDAIATAPLNKAALHAAGHSYPGHTEILAEFCGVEDFAMMLHLPESRLQPLRSLVSTSRASAPRSRIRKNSGPASRSRIRQNSGSANVNVHEQANHGLSVAHVTLHTSIASVPALLSTDDIVATTQLMDEFLGRIGSQRRAIAVAALNPHGGEGGLFGDEETRLIIPAVDQSRAAGCNVTGPLPVDTLMRRAIAGEFDGVIAMYHDQGHIPIKLIGFDSAINITLGLPIVRTSPTHGTAFDRAWNPATPADPSGMIEAILMAAELASTG